MRILLATEILPGTIMLPILHYYYKLITASGFMVICIYPYVNWKLKHTILLSLYLVGMASEYCSHRLEPFVVSIFHASSHKKTWGAG